MPGSATVTIDTTSWRVSIASTPAELAQGLGGISSLPEGWGMLFDLGYTRQVTVTTRPMLFDLDIVFLDDDLRVSGVFGNVPPDREITTECRYFLEVNAGEAAGVELGDQAQVVCQPAELTEPVSIELAVSILSVMMVTAAGLSALAKQ